jgi:RNA polymerase sigma-70 factor (ECF subfamily)
MSLKDFVLKPKEDTGQKNRGFTELYDRTFDKVYGFLVARLFGDSHAAADLTQETFLAVYQSIQNYSGRSSETTWVIGIAKNKLYDFFRSRFRQKKWSEPLGDTDFTDDRLEDTILSYENTELIRKVLKLLPEQYRMLLNLKYMENLKLREIAALTGRTVKSVDGLIQRAKTAFIKTYREYESGGHDYETKK